MLNALAEVDRQEGPPLRQLAAGVLLGAPNLKQTKLLDSPCLSFLLGPSRWRRPPALRKQLHRLDALERIGVQPGLSVLTRDPASTEGEAPSSEAEVESFDSSVTATTVQTGS
jgi:hypothetical protein